MTQAIVSGAVCLAALLPPAHAADVPVTRVSLDQGFRLLYNLEFDQAHQVFLSWQSEHPQDPVGPTAEAAGLLFSEFHRLGVLESQFYSDDKSFQNRQKWFPIRACATVSTQHWLRRKLPPPLGSPPALRIAMPCLP